MPGIFPVRLSMARVRSLVLVMEILTESFRVDLSFWSCGEGMLVMSAMPMILKCCNSCWRRLTSSFFHGAALVACFISLPLFFSLLPGGGVGSW